MVSEHVKLTDIALSLEMSPPFEDTSLWRFPFLRTVIVTNSNSQVTMQNMLKIIAGGS